MNDTELSPIKIMASKFGMNSDKMMDTLKATVMTNATNEQATAFLIVANQYDLNPFQKEIYAFPAKGGGITPMVPVDGWCKIVNRHVGADGQPDFDGCEFEELDGPNGLPDRITCKMHVKGRMMPVCATERFAECKRDTTPWKQHPYRMLRHKAYIQAARYAFGLSGIHDEDEARDITASVTVVDPVKSKPDRSPIKQPESVKEQSDDSGKAEANTFTAEIILDAPQTQDGKSAKGEWHRTYAKGSDGAYYQTFDTKIAAEMFRLSGYEVSILYKVSKTEKGESRQVLSIQEKGL